MSKKNDELWNQKFELYKEYVNAFHKFPSSHTIYKGVDVGEWIYNQISFYKRKELPEDREKLLNDFNPIWKDSVKKKHIENHRLLLESEWKKNVPEGNTPIDVFLFGVELDKNLRNGIYDCESWIDSNYNVAPIDKVFECYEKIFPFIESKYLGFLHVVKEKALGNYLETKTFLNEFNFVSSSDVEKRVEQFIGTLEDREQEIIRLYYLEGNTLDLMAEKIGLCKVHAQRVRDMALRKLMYTSRLNVLYSHSFEVRNIVDLGLSERTKNSLHRGGIRTVDELINIVNNEPEKLRKMRYLGDKSVEEIMDRVAKLSNKA